MENRIIVDSCGEFPSAYQSDPSMVHVALSIQVGTETIVDDETFDQASFLQKVKQEKECPRSSCPSPEAYQAVFPEQGDIYIVTLSSQLSGSYNSACLAKKIYLEEHPGRNIAVIDSRSASVGETLIALKIKEYIAQGKSFEEIEFAANQFRDGLSTKFVLETLETLRKNGRLSNLKAALCNALNIKPIMGGTKEGTICKLDQARGMNRALQCMVKQIQQEVQAPEQRTVAIAHCNCPARAKQVKEMILQKINFQDCFILDTAGISSLYANEGGIIVSY